MGIPTINRAAVAGGSLASAKMLVGDASNLAAAVDLSNDVTVSNTGAVTIANSAVEAAMLQTNLKTGFL